MKTLILSDDESAMLASILSGADEQYNRVIRDIRRDGVEAQPWIIERSEMVSDLLERLANAGEENEDDASCLASAVETIVLAAEQDRDPLFANGSTIFIGTVFHSYDHHDIVGAFLTPEEADAACQTYGDSLIASGIGPRRFKVDSYSITVSRLVVGEAQATQISERHVEHDDELARHPLT